MNQQSRASRVSGWLAEQWWMDWLIGAAIVIYGVRFSSDVGFNPLASVTDDNLLNVLSGLLTLVTFFAGFVTLAFTAFLALPGQAVKQLRRKLDSRLIRMWSALIVTTWAMAIAVWIASVGAASDPIATWSGWLALAALVVLVLQLTRVLWLFLQLVSLDHVAVVPSRPTADRAIRLVPRGERRTAAEETRDAG